MAADSAKENAEQRADQLVRLIAEEHEEEDAVPGSALQTFKAAEAEESEARMAALLRDESEDVEEVEAKQEVAESTRAHSHYPS